MAIYSNLPVFKASYDLVIDVFAMCNTLNRDYRYSVGEKLKNALIELMIGIYKANLMEDKQPFVVQGREQMVEITLYLRLLHDLKQLSVKRFAGLAQKTEAISKQLKAWHGSFSKLRIEN